MLYEDFESGKAAKRTCDQLTSNLLDYCTARTQMWKLEVLTIPKLRELSLQDALQADVLVVSLRGDKELPAHVLVWLEQWLSEPRRAMALLALFSPECQHHWRSAQLRGFFKSIAARAGVEFFSDTGREASFKEDEFRQARQIDPLVLSTHTSNGNPAPRWGINE